MSIEIRSVTTIDECRQIEDVICEAWGGDAAIAIPDHLSITVAREPGGVVLLARDGKKPVGFCWGFLSFEGEGSERRLKHCSHMTGVIPSYRGRQLGERLKWAQRQAVLDQGIDHITWTFDPLETLNARLNLHKLGAVCRRYRRDVYGALRDSLNFGVATDRFAMDWWLKSAWVGARKQRRYRAASRQQWLDEGALPLNQPAAYDDVGEFADIEELVAQGRPTLLLSVPRKYQAIKRDDLELAVKWRQYTRGVFERAFSSDYTAVELLAGDSFCTYVLRKNFTPDQDGSEFFRRQS